MSTSNQQKPQGPGDVEHTQKLPRAEKSSSSRTSTGASPASRSVAGSGTETAAASPKPAAKRSPKKAPAKKATSGQPTTVGEKLAADAASKTSTPAGTDDADTSTSTEKQEAKNEKTAGAAAKGSSSDTSAKVAGAGASGAAAKKATTKGAGSSSAKKSSSPSARSDSPAKPKESPMTARDYARTTGGGVDSTSVIPAVRDEPKTAAPAPAVTPASGSERSARLRLVHIEPWSVTRLAFVVSVALMIVSVVAVAIFWLVLDLAGVWESLNGTITNVLSDGEAGFDLTDYLGLGRLLGLTLLLSAINVIVMTMIATIAAHLYNLAAQLLGGVDVTFSDQ